jgi:hypothetical protein
MIVSTIFQAVVIGVLSTGLYVVFTNGTHDRRHEYICIASIVTIVAALLLLMMQKTDSLVVKEHISASYNHKPPF